MVLESLAPEVDPSEVRGTDTSPGSLARLATRAELRQPGTLERAFGGQGGGWGAGMMGSFLPVLAGAFVGTAIADMLFGSYGYPPGDPAADAMTGEGMEAADAGSDGHAAGGSWDDGSTAGAGDLGDAGGDVGGDLGGDFGDFGGGDFGGF
jgi:hypothetical protein